MNDEILLKQLVRQMKILNIWVSLFGGLVVIGLLVMGFLMYQVVMFVQETNSKIENVKDGISSSVDVKGKACNGDGTVTTFLRENTATCN